MKILFIIGFLTAVAGCIPQPVYRASTSSYQPTPAPRMDSVKTANSTGPVTNADRKDAMLKEIETWMGTPYRFGMIEKKKGVDCSGFVGSVFLKVLKMELPRQASDMYAGGRSITRDELKFGDLVFFQNTYKGASGASHVGIYVGDDRIAHASTTVGVTYSALSEKYYQQHYLGCRRVIKD